MPEPPSDKQPDLVLDEDIKFDWNPHDKCYLPRQLSRFPLGPTPQPPTAKDAEQTQAKKDREARLLAAINAARAASEDEALYRTLSHLISHHGRLQVSEEMFSIVSPDIQDADPTGVEWERAGEGSPSPSFLSKVGRATEIDVERWANIRGTADSFQLFCRQRPGFTPETGKRNYKHAEQLRTWAQSQSLRHFVPVRTVHREHVGYVEVVVVPSIAGDTALHYLPELRWPALWVCNRV
ncbi:hypothetical protein CEP54_001842 [Fusarium duplospermum]|uniref:Uncharacterized protein n=1 Tax=Fusarium duplospermum TaxID=1325734 RepID=A0A428QYD7_9HYPO|nr:hypothetical protein CEP54_001842 [Fusarium duplospermum]